MSVVRDYMDKKYYVYEWFNKITGEVFYVGKGCGNRYKESYRRNKLFKEYYANNEVDVRIVKYFDKEEAAFEYEKKITEQYREKGQCGCNLIDGGYGGYSSVWSETARQYKSKYNPMKEEKQRKRMSKSNPMKNPDVVKRVSEQHIKKICIGDKIYNGWGEAAAVCTKS